jgi:recombination protein RecT
MAAAATRELSLTTFQDVDALLKRPSVQDRIAKLLPQHIKPERLTRVVLNAWQREPALRSCTPASFVLAVLEAAALGLEPDGLLGQGWIIPFKKTAKFIPGYRGLMQLAYRTGEVVSWKAVCVHSNDKYKYSEGLHPLLEHEPTSATDEGDVVAAYSIIQYKDGPIDFEWMWRKDLEKIRKMSAYPDGKPWKEHTDEMYKKTVIRRHSKRARLSIEDLSRAAKMDEERELGIPGAETFLPSDLVSDLLDGAVIDVTDDSGGTGSGGQRSSDAKKVSFQETIPDDADLNKLDEFLKVCVAENAGYTIDKVKEEATLSPEENAKFWAAYNSWLKSQQTFEGEVTAQIGLITTTEPEKKEKKKKEWATKNAAGEDAVTCKPRGGKAMSPAICEACSAPCQEFASYKKWKA